MPDLKDSILILEDDKGTNPYLFNRDLQSIINLPNFSEVKGIMIGRFQQASGFTNDIIKKIIKTKRELNNIPVIANLDFGHTNPIVTLPIGGELALKANKNDEVEILIKKH